MNLAVVDGCFSPARRMKSCVTMMMGNPLLGWVEGEGESHQRKQAAALVHSSLWLFHILSDQRTKYHNSYYSISAARWIWVLSILVIFGWLENQPTDKFKVKTKTISDLGLFVSRMVWGWSTCHEQCWSRVTSAPAPITPYTTYIYNYTIQTLCTWDSNRLGKHAALRCDFPWWQQRGWRGAGVGGKAVI